MAVIVEIPRSRQRTANGPFGMTEVREYTVTGTDVENVFIPPYPGGVLAQNIGQPHPGFDENGQNLMRLSGRAVDPWSEDHSVLHVTLTWSNDQPDPNGTIWESTNTTQMEPMRFGLDAQDFRRKPIVVNGQLTSIPTLVPRVTDIATRPLVDLTFQHLGDIDSLLATTNTLPFHGSPQLSWLFVGANIQRITGKWVSIRYNFSLASFVEPGWLKILPELDEDGNPTGEVVVRRYVAKDYSILGLDDSTP